MHYKDYYVTTDIADNGSCFDVWLEKPTQDKEGYWTSPYFVVTISRGECYKKFGTIPETWMLLKKRTIKDLEFSEGIL